MHCVHLVCLHLRTQGGFKGLGFSQPLSSMPLTPTVHTDAGKESMRLTDERWIICLSELSEVRATLAQHRRLDEKDCSRTTLGCVMFLQSSDSRSADIWLATLPSCAMTLMATVPPRQRPLYTLP